jgi:hypothetical protein
LGALVSVKWAKRASSGSKSRGARPAGGSGILVMDLLHSDDAVERPPGCRASHAAAASSHAAPACEGKSRAQGGRQVSKRGQSKGKTSHTQTQHNGGRWITQRTARLSACVIGRSWPPAAAAGAACAAGSGAACTT